MQSIFILLFLLQAASLDVAWGMSQSGFGILHQ
jgi:hypothetical protein